MSDIATARHLEYLTLGCSLAEATAAITAGVIAASIALVGFGADSLIESASGAVLLWRLQGGEVGEKRERLALRLVGVSLLVLALYILADAVKSLIWREQPEPSTIGIVVAILSLIVMPLLARAKQQVGRRMESKALIADSKQTAICAYLSAILLVGLILNRLFGLWWTDPVAALLMVPIIVREGVEALKGETCCN
jgi:divalent metal cation (Fe/Co/Zn/Cd) transporter